MPEILKEYFSKSKVFLLPALGLRTNDHLKIMNTFIAWENRYTFQDYRLMLIKEGPRRNSNYLMFEKIYLQTSKFFEEMIFVNSDLVVYIFNLEQLKADWDCFLAAKYSHLSPGLKERIKDHYGSDTNEWEYIEPFLYPNQYFDIYADLLYSPKDHDKGLELIKSVGELCNPFDTKKEVFTTVTNYLEKPAVAIE